MTFNIEKNIPLTTDGRGAHGGYPFASMEVGDSFYVTGDDRFTKARYAASSFGRYHKKKFTARADHNGGRIWRVE